MFRVSSLFSGIRDALRRDKGAAPAPEAAGEGRFIGRLMAEAYEATAVRAEFADRLNALGIGGALPREAFEFRVADALGLYPLERPGTVAARARQYADEVAALVGDGWKPADALRATVAEFGKAAPRLREPEEAKAEIARMLSGSPESSEPPFGELSEDDILANIAREQREEPASGRLDRLSPSQLSALLDIYNELLWARVGPRGLLQSVDYGAVRHAVTAVFVGFAGPIR